MHRNQVFWKQVGGFTLIELLASVTVAGVLAAMLGTGFQATVDNARTVQCVGNLRTITTGAICWANDRNGRLWTKEELGFSKYRQVKDPLGLPQLLQDYVPLKAWVCPAARRILRDYGNGYTWTVATEFTGDFIEPGITPQKSISAAGNLDNTIIVWDAFNFTSPSLFNKFDDKRGDGSTGPSTATRYYPHRKNKAINYGYLDGHVETR